jgi:hypothetical protein
MIFKLPTEKQEIIVNECKKNFKRDKDTIRNVAKVIGLIVSTFSAVQYGKLHQYSFSLLYENMKSKYYV